MNWEVATLTYADIAGKYGGNESAIRRCGAHEGWTEERVNQATLLQQKATQKSAYNQAEELARCNEDDLRIAGKIQTGSIRAVKSGVRHAPSCTRSLEAVAEGAQRMARLALGVSTENLHTTHDPYAAMSDAELAAELQGLGIEPTEPKLQ